MIFHALDPDSNEIVDFDTFIANLDEEVFFDAVHECQPETITVRQNETKHTLSYHQEQTHIASVLSFVVNNVTVSGVNFWSSGYSLFIVSNVY